MKYTIDDINDIYFCKEHRKKEIDCYINIKHVICYYLDQLDTDQYMISEGFRHKFLKIYDQLKEAKKEFDLLINKIES